MMTRMMNGHQVTTQMMHEGQGQAKEGTTGVAEARDTTCLDSQAPWYVFFALRTTLMMTNSHTHHHMPSPSPEWTQAWGETASRVLGEGLRRRCVWALFRYVSFIMFFYSALNDYFIYKMNTTTTTITTNQPEEVWAQDVPITHYHHTTNSSAQHTSDTCWAFKLVKKNCFIFWIY